MVLLYILLSIFTQILKRDTPYLALMGELWGVFCEDLAENWLLKNIFDISDAYFPQLLSYPTENYVMLDHAITVMSQHWLRGSAVEDGLVANRHWASFFMWTNEDAFGFYVQCIMMTSSNEKHFPHYWPFVRHRSPVDSPHKARWRGALMFSLSICTWTNG